MTQNEKIQQEIERTLQSLDNVNRAEANPFLFTRIKARMTRQQSGVWERTFSFLNRPLIAMAVLVLIMAVNGWSFFGSSPSTIISPTGPGMSTANVDLPEFENEYRSIISTDSYDYENINNQ